MLADSEVLEVNWCVEEIKEYKSELNSSASFLNLINSDVSV